MDEITQPSSANHDSAPEQIRTLENFKDQLEQCVAVRTAELVEANRALAQINQENEMFVYSVSHDLRSPLVNLQGFSKELTLVSEELHALLQSDKVPAELRERALSLLDQDMAESIRFIRTA